MMNITMNSSEYAFMNNNPLPFPWFEGLNFEEELNQCNYTLFQKEQIKHFAEYGYLIFDPEIEYLDDLIKQIRKELDPVYQDSSRSNWFSNETRIQDAWYFNQCESVRQIASAPKVLEILKILYQREPIPFQTLNFPIGTQQRTHSDTYHFHSIPYNFMCGVWVALEDIDKFNGPLHYYPKSHKIPLLKKEELSINNYSEYELLVEALMKSMKMEKVSLSLKKGEALIWAANLFHGGDPILDKNRTRYSQVTHYFFADCLYYCPQKSDQIIDGVYPREIINIATNKLVPHYYQGKYYSYEALKKLKRISKDIVCFPNKKKHNIEIDTNPHRPSSLLTYIANQFLPTDFDEKLYLKLNPDVDAAGMSGKMHYIIYGINEGRIYR